jgi:hypothetical protein
MALLSQKGKTETTQEQLSKVQEVQQKMEKEMSPVPAPASSDAPPSQAR